MDDTKSAVDAINTIRAATLSIENTARLAAITDIDNTKVRTEFQKAMVSVQHLRSVNGGGMTLWATYEKGLYEASKKYYLARQKQLDEIQEQEQRLAVLRDPSDIAVTALADATQRAIEVDKLLKSLKELSEMFNDLALLINEQSQTLIKIEVNVHKAGTAVASGNRNLASAIAAQKKTRKIYCCMCVVFLVIMLIVIGLGVGFGVPSIRSI